MTNKIDSKSKFLYKISMFNKKMRSDYTKAQNRIIDSVEKQIKDQFKYEGTGHDWLHTNNVRNLSLILAKHEPGKKNIYIIELAALLHDYDDWKFKDARKNKPSVKDLLLSLCVPENVINTVHFITENISFKGGTNSVKMNTLEGQIVQDADRLEAIGAIGIARTFAYGGSQGRIIYDPSIPPVKADTADAYRLSRSTTINHFYEKLLLLKSKLNTNTAKKIARKRHAFMLQFLKRFYAEYNGEL